MFKCYVSMPYSSKFDLTVVTQESDHSPFQADIKYNLGPLLSPHGVI